jgi:hypothetical protein
MKMRNRKSLFLHSTILRGRFLKDGDEVGGSTGNDGIEVGAGFAQAAEQQASDDNRTPEQKEHAQVPAKQGEEVGDNSDEGGDGDDEGGDDEGGDEGDDEAPKPRKKRDTAEYIRELKRERREERAARIAMEARLAAIENSSLPENKSDDSKGTTRAAPDPTDATKYPLGVLDDGYIEDKIEWAAEQKVAAVLDGKLQTEQEQAETARQTEHLTTLRSKVDSLAAKGAEVYDDYEEKVLEAGLRGDYQLTETTFTAASETEHAVEILYALANDKTEAKRVAELTPYQQLKYVAEKDAEFSAKAKPRRKPQADNPPENLPRGRNSSNPVRADTDNLDDFRKLYYRK